jgi:hypothetical protein
MRFALQDFSTAREGTFGGEQVYRLTNRKRKDFFPIEKYEIVIQAGINSAPGVLSDAFG